MKTLLLAAGQSIRMCPIEDKNFLMFFGKPLIEYQIENLRLAGLKDILIVGGKHNLKRLQKYGKTVEQKNLDDGMAGALLAAERHIKNGSLLIVSSNDIVESDAFTKLTTYGAERMTSLLLAKRVKSYFPGGYLKTDKKGRVQKIVEKPGAGNEPSDLVNIVVHFHRDPKLLIETLKKTKTSKDDRYEAALDAMIKSGVDIRAIPYSGFWQPVKYPWHVLWLMKHFLKQKCNGKPFIEKSAKIMAGAIVTGSIYIGKNTVIGNNALVRDSYIGDNSVIGFGSEVARSYLGEGVRTHTNYIGDSIIGDNTSFGAGCVTGNLRLDEKEISVPIRQRDNTTEKVPCGSNKFGLVTGKNVRAGINTSFMPGIKIGNDSFIGAGITVSEDIPDKKFVSGKWELKVKLNTKH